VRQENQEFTSLWESSGWSKAETARKLDLDRSSIGKFITGQIAPSSQTLKLFKLILADEVPGALTGATQLQENEMGLSEWEAELLGELRLLHTEDRQRVLNAVKAFVAGLPKREPMKYPTPASSVPESPSGRLLKKLTSGLYKRGGNPSP